MGSGLGVNPVAPLPEGNFPPGASDRGGGVGAPHGDVYNPNNPAANAEWRLTQGANPALSGVLPEDASGQEPGWGQLGGGSWAEGWLHQFLAMYPSASPQAKATATALSSVLSIGFANQPLPFGDYMGLILDSVRRQEAFDRHFGKPAMGGGPAGTGAPGKSKGAPGTGGSQPKPKPAGSGNQKVQ